jgi:hypothetical protein
LRAEGFFYNLDIGTLWRPRDRKIAVFDPKKMYKNFSAVIFFSIFGHESPGSGLDPDPDPDWWSS